MNIRMPHSPFFYYAFVLATGGLFAYVWRRRLPTDSTESAGKKIFNTKMLSILMGMLFLLDAGAIFLLLVSFSTSTSAAGLEPVTWISNLVILVSVFLFVMLNILVVSVYRYSFSLDAKEPPPLTAVKIVSLTLLMYISLPYLQKRLNTEAVNRGKTTITRSE